MIAMMISKEKIFTQRVWVIIRIYTERMAANHQNDWGETEFNPRWDEPKEAQDSWMHIYMTQWHIHSGNQQAETKDY